MRVVKNIDVNKELSSFSRMFWSYTSAQVVITESRSD